MGLRGIALGVAAVTAIGCVTGLAINHNTKLQDNNKQLAVEVENIREDTTLQQSIASDLLAKKETLQAEIDTMIAEKETIVSQVEVEQGKYNSLVAEKTALTNTYNDLVETNNLSLEQKHELETAIAEMETQIIEIQSNIDELNTSIGEKHAVITFLENQLNEVCLKMGSVSVYHEVNLITIPFTPRSFSDPEKEFPWYSLTIDGSNNGGVSEFIFSGSDLINAFCSDDTYLYLDTSGVSSVDIYRAETDSNSAEIENSVTLQFADDVDLVTYCSIDLNDISIELIDPDALYESREAFCGFKYDDSGRINEVWFTIDVSLCEY